MLSNVLPANLEAEKDALAAMLRDEKVLDKLTLKLPTEGLSYDGRHQAQARLHADPE